MSLPTQRSQKIFGLLIGIDEYQSPDIRGLSGAVADTEAVSEFFKETLNVPSKHFTILHNRSATRSAIINALSLLKDDNRILRGDAIFIFFAGHGSEIPAPKGWEAGGPGSMIQVIIPHDYCEISGREVQAIPDRTIGALLEEIAENKGNNITVVLDCCHSASGTRGLAGSSASGIRSGAVDPSIHSSQLDHQIWNSRPRPPPLHIGLHSHVLLAACSAGELAREHNARGIFTKALLAVLAESDVSTLRYSDIMQNMIDIPGQHPQCEGVHQNRHIFSSEDPPPGPALYTPFYQRQANSEGGYNFVFSLNAGSAHGLTTGDELTIYSDRDALSEQPLGILLVDKIDNFSAVLKLPPGVTELHNFTSDAVAVKSKSSKREVFKLGGLHQLPRHRQESQVDDALQNPDGDFQNIVLAIDNVEETHITVNSNDSGDLSVHITDPRVTKYGVTPQFRNGATLKPEDVAQVLKGGLEYFWELDRTSSSTQTLEQDIKVQLYKLHTAESQFPDVQYELHPLEPNLCQNGEINIKTHAKELSLYGIKITNTSNFDIYPKVCYFNPNDLSVDTAYEPPVGLHGPAVPLRPHGGTLTIGYGSGGRRPFIPPPLTEGQVLHVGFLKIFLFTQSLDCTPRQPRSPTRHTAIQRPKPTWDTIVIPVIQHRDDTAPPSAIAYNATWPSAQTAPLAGR